MAIRRRPTVSRGGLVLHAIAALRMNGYIAQMRTAEGGSTAAECEAWAAEALDVLTAAEREFALSIENGTCADRGALRSIVERRFGHCQEIHPDHPLWPHAGPAPGYRARAEVEIRYRDWDGLDGYRSVEALRGDLSTGGEG